MVASGVKGVDVLLVDDEPLVARLYARALQAQGWSVEAAENALVALDAIERAPPRLVISDMQMPSMTGLEMLEEMVANNRKTMPLMFMSGARAGEIVDPAGGVRRTGRLRPVVPAAGRAAGARARGP